MPINKNTPKYSLVDGVSYIPEWDSTTIVMLVGVALTWSG